VKPPHQPFVGECAEQLRDVLELRLLALPAHREADAAEAQQHHRPRGRFGHCGSNGRLSNRDAQAVRDSSATPTRLIGEQVAQVVSAADRRVERLRKDVVARAAPTGKADVASPVDASVVLVR